MVINTAVGVQRVPADFMNVAVEQEATDEQGA
jgi:hypothetical protein